MKPGDLYRWGNQLATYLVLSITQTNTGHRDGLEVCTCLIVSNWFEDSGAITYVAKVAKMNVESIERLA